MAGEDRSFRQRTVIEFLVKGDVPASDIHAQFQRTCADVCMSSGAFANNFVSLKTRWTALWNAVKDAYWWSFCHKRKPSMLLVTLRRSRSFVVYCVTDVQESERASCDTTTHSPTLLVCAWRGSEERLGTSSSTLQSGPSPRTAICWVRKGSDSKPAVCDQWGGPENPSPLVTCYWNGIATSLEGWQTCVERDGDFVKRECSTQIWLTWCLSVRIFTSFGINLLVTFGMAFLHFSSFPCSLHPHLHPHPNPSALTLFP